MRTSQIALECGIHVNSVLFYERIGLISPVSREPNGYRRFSERHLCQIKVLRLIYGGEWPGRAVRRAAQPLIEAMRTWRIGEAWAALEEYRRIIDAELESAERAVELLRNWEAGDGGEEISLPAAAALLNSSRETIRNWERNRLIEIPRRGPHRTRYVTPAVLNKLRIIAVLRKGGHSIALIHHALRRWEESGPEEAMRSFEEPEGFEILTASDQFLKVLRRTCERAERIPDILKLYTCPPP